MSVGLAVAGLSSALGAQRAPADTPPPTSVPAATTSAPAATSAAPTTAAPSTSGAPTTTVAAAPRLLDPEPVPGDARADVAVLPIGRIRIPAIGLDHEIYEGIWLTVIDVGPGHWPGTPLPGRYGNAVFGGHRVTHSHPFLDLDRLAVGDRIEFSVNDGTTAIYAVTEQLIVDPSALWIVDQAPGHTVTLFACHPKGSARQRIVIRAELLSEPVAS